MDVIRALDRFLGWSERAFLVLANGCVAVMLVANMINMAVRAVFDTSFVQVWPWTMLLFVWSIYLGFYVLYRRGKDVTVNFLVSRLAAAARRRVQLLVNLLIVGFMAVMVAGTWQYLPLQAGVLELVGLPRWAQSVPLLASCALILLNALVQAADLMLSGDASRPRCIRDRLTSSCDERVEKFMDSRFRGNDVTDVESVIPAAGSVIPAAGSVIPAAGSVIPAVGSVIPAEAGIHERKPNTDGSRRGREGPGALGRP